MIVRWIGALVVLVLLCVASAPRPAAACDICAIYTSVDLSQSRSGFRLGLAQQYTNFGTRMVDSEEVENPGERLQSSITQILLGYNFGPEWGLQVNLPFIYRPYTRLEDGELVSGSESGIGDMSLLGSWVPFRTVSERGLARFTLFGGLKFPTGNSDPLGDEIQADIDDQIRDRFLDFLGLGSVKHGGVAHDESPSAIHGHDIALGTGSYDGVIGGQLFLSWDRFFWTTSAQYTIRTEGSFDYRYANDLSFNTGPGYFAYLDHGWLIGIQAIIAGETKGKDELAGAPVDDTAATFIYAGPGLRVGYGTNLSAEVVGDIPFIRHETSLQIVPDYRIRGGLVWRF